MIQFLVSWLLNFLSFHEEILAKAIAAKSARGAKTNQADGRLARLLETRRRNNSAPSRSLPFFAPFALFCGQ
ncbi:MAG: hypothetical protein EXS38_02860 [Opitutus sp.]|nr:hypothetical protein [Opitutus sp.]